ncbi:MAG TPA: response regulator [Terriglobales bacterium]|nr:response regulator [Terriglobales bacterium]
MAEAARDEPAVSALVRSFRRFARAAAVVAMLVGIVVLGGWFFDLATLKSVLPGLVAMNFNTALSFALAGLALWLLAPDSVSAGKSGLHFTGFACAALVTLAGALTLSQYLFNWNAGIDQLLFPEPAPAVDTSHPGRMAPVTALNFFLLGAALLLLETPRRVLQFLRFCLAAAVFLSSFLGLIGYLYGVRQFYGQGPFTAIALHTAATFFLLSLGIICSRLEQGPTVAFAGDTTGGMMARRLFPAALLTPTVLDWLRLQGEAHSLYGMHFGVALFTTASAMVFAALAWLNAVALDRLDRQRRQAEEGLREQTRILQSILDCMGDGVVVVDQDRRFLVFNRAAEQLLGRGPVPADPASWPEFYGLYYPDRITPFRSDDLPSARALRGESTDGIEFFVRHPGQTEGRWAQASGRPLLDDRGRIRGAVVVSHDITQRKRFEEALRRSEENYRSLVEHIPDVVWTADSEARATFISSNMERLSGFTAEEIEAGGPEVWFQRVHPDHAQRARDAYREMFETRAPLDVEYPIQRKDGRWIWVHVHADHVYQAEGRVFASGIVSDVTRSKQLEEDLRRLNAELAAANQELEQRSREAEHATQLKSRFLASMSHELRTPLTAIIGFSDLLGEEIAGALNPKQRRYVEHARQAARHLLQLINDILDLSKIEAGQIEFRPETFSVAEALPEVLTTIRPLSLGRRVRLQTRMDDLRVFADRIRFKQILYNLISNAIKFTPEGGCVSVESALCGAFVEVSVIDTGVGIAADELEVIFDEFRQVGDSARGLKEGTGLGLAITRRLVEQQGGTIRVASEPGRGSRFTFALPAALPTEVTREPAPQRPRASRRVQPLVLIVDDEPAARELLVEYLSPQGYELATAASGDEGLQKARDLQPDAITLNMLMPGKNGWETLRRLKADRSTAWIPVIIVSVVDQRNVGFALGAADYLVKPVPKQVLLQAVRKWLPRTDGRPSILVVDDEPQALQMMAEVLEAAGYRIAKASGGREALEAMRRHPPHGLLLDLLMPEVDGFEVIRQMKEDGALRDIPVFVLTAKDLTEVDVEFLRQQTRAFFRKNASWKQELLAQVQAAVSRTAEGARP